MMGKETPERLSFKKEFQGYYKLLLLNRTNAAICLVWALAQNSTLQKMYTIGVWFSQFHRSIIQSDTTQEAV